jgi:hypothetical protein
VRMPKLRLMSYRSTDSCFLLKRIAQGVRALHKRASGAGGHFRAGTGAYRAHGNEGELCCVLLTSGKVAIPRRCEMLFGEAG